GVTIPVIDLGGFAAGDEARTARQVGEACARFGFFAVTGHAVPQAVPRHALPRPGHPRGRREGTKAGMLRSRRSTATVGRRGTTAGRPLPGPWKHDASSPRRGPARPDHPRGGATPAPPVGTGRGRRRLDPRTNAGAVAKAR